MNFKGWTLEREVYFKSTPNKLSSLVVLNKIGICTRYFKTKFTHINDIDKICELCDKALGRNVKEWEDTISITSINKIMKICLNVYKDSTLEDINVLTAEAISTRGKQLKKG